MLCLLIKHIDFGLGFAIGIFAVFGIIRFRTIPIATREMTYLFIAIGIGATNALVPNEANYLGLLTAHFYLILMLYFLEKVFNKELNRTKKEVTYTNLSLVHPDQHHLLKEDLSKKYGLEQIEKIEIGKIDEVRQIVKLDVYLNNTPSKARSN